MKEFTFRKDENEMTVAMVIGSERRGEVLDSLVSTDHDLLVWFLVRHGFHEADVRYAMAVHQGKTVKAEHPIFEKLAQKRLGKTAIKP